MKCLGKIVLFVNMMAVMFLFVGISSAYMITGSVLDMGDASAYPGDEVALSVSFDGNCGLGFYLLI